MSILAETIWIPSGVDLQMFAPELALIGAIVSLLVVPLIVGRGSQTSAGIALIGALATLLLTASVAKDIRISPHAGFAPAGVSPMLLVDSFGVFFKLFLMLFLSLVIGLWLMGLSSKDKQRQATLVQPSSPEFFVLLLVSALGMALMVGTLNLLVIMIAIEMASLPSYAIVGSNKTSRRSAEASLKYVMFGAASAAIMAYGVSLIYGCFGSLYIPDIARGLAADGSRLGLVAGVGFAAMIVGILFKISAVPFHFWCPDVFEGAPIEVTTWLSVASKAAGLGLLLRIVHALCVGGPIDHLGPLAWGIGLIAAVTCTVGNLAALRQESVKRILAYSSISHAGYMMMAGAILVKAGSSAHPGLAALIAYLLVYLLMNIGAFGVTAMVVWHTGSDHLSAFSGLGRRAPMLALPMTICLFSLVGLPPLAGFAAKWWLLFALGEAAANQPWLWGLVVVAVVNTAISLYYYVGIAKQMYLSDDPGQSPVDAPLGGVAMVNLAAVGLVLLGTIFFNPLGQKARQYANRLYTEPSYSLMQPLASPSIPSDDPIRSVAVVQDASSPEVAP